MKNFQMLQTIEGIFKKNELDVSFLHAGEENPIDSLALFLGADKENRPYLLSITSEEQILNPKKESHLYRVSFKIKMPFKINDLSISQVSNLIALLNHHLDLPGFEMNEVESELFYRHILMIDKKGMSDELILGIVGMIKFIIDLHVPSVEAVATGVLSYDELLREALQIK